MPHNGRRQVVVLGTGFGAVSLIKELRGKDTDVTVVSPRNHFLFSPLLPSTTVGTIEFRSIIEPVRTACPGVTYYQAEAIGLDPDARTVQCVSSIGRQAFSLGYDMLVIAVGAVANTFGVPGVKEHTLFLKELADARAIRQRIIDCFERATQPGVTPEEWERLLTFVVVGGGPTGVEFAAEMHDFITQDLKRVYPKASRQARITLLEAGESLLGSFDETLRDYTMKHFRHQQIDVRLGSLVTAVEAERLQLKDGGAVPFGLTVWSTGIAATDFVLGLPFERDRANRLVIDEYLRVPGQEAVYAVGDCAAFYGSPYPATAQVAQQQGAYLGRMAKAQRRGKPVVPFAYKHMGMMAYIGSNKALADLSKLKGKGFTTWLMWRSAYLTKLVSFKNKILVVFDWMKAWIFGRDISRF